MSDSNKVESTRQFLVDAQNQGLGATLGAYVRLSGPGWLQSAITLGGGSLAGALFLGSLGGTNLLWLQLIAIIMGVIMLSAISYVSLSTGERPFRAINKHINPALGWGWIIATITANMIWCLPQFSLCFAALKENLIGDTIGDSTEAKMTVSGIVLVAASCVVLLSSRQGFTAKLFDWVLKAMVGIIVICFFGVVVYMSVKGELNWSEIIQGFIPDLSQWSRPTGEVADRISQMPAEVQEFWTAKIITAQRSVMIGAAATAVGINMTFLLPYSMLNRGWDKPFRGLARFDLSTGMAIPYILVTSCVVIAAAQSFHGKVDEKFLSSDPAVMQESSLFKSAKGNLIARVKTEQQEATAAPADSLNGEQKETYYNAWVVVGKDAEVLTKATADKPAPVSSYDDLNEQQQAEAQAAPATLAAIAALPPAEKEVAGSLVQRNAFQLSNALGPLLGDNSKYIFGIGIFGMGFSTIIILMLINGYAFSEMFGLKQGGAPHVFGCLLAGCVGACWPFVWDGASKVWLAVLVSAFGMMLLPIAYVTFFMMMNSRRLMGDEKPRGVRLLVWNVLMAFSVIGAIAAAAAAIIEKSKNAIAGKVVIGVGVIYVLLVLVGFILKRHDSDEITDDAETSSKPAAE